MQNQVEDNPRRPNEELEQAIASLQIDLLHMKHRNALIIGVNKAREKAASLAAKHAKDRLQVPNCLGFC